jgi:alpha-L-fucosidase
MFDSGYTDFKITNTPYKKDITLELTEAFRKKGIKIGFYHSLVDWRHPDFIPDEEHPDWKDGQRDFSNRNLENYQKYLYNTVEQLMSNYGKIDLLFFDYTSKYKKSSEWNPEPLLEMIYRLQPEIMVNDRLSFDKKSFIGNYCTPEISVPNAPLRLNGEECLWETCMTLNNNWGYCETDKNYKPLSTTTTALFHCVSKKGNLLLNIGPESKGKFPAESISKLKELADWMSINEESIRGAGRAEYTAPGGYFYTQKDKVIYLYLTTQPMGDIILPELEGKIESINNLRTGDEVAQITHWGYELLQENEIRIRPLNCKADDVLKIILK